MKQEGRDPWNGFELTTDDFHSTRWVEVPYFSNGIPCGGFEDCGEYDYERTFITEEEYATGGRVVVRARGSSMVGVGIHDDDELVVSVQPVAEDGDIVVARCGNEQTIKVLHYDERGRAWLVPQNLDKRYEPLAVTEETRIYGRVLTIHHHNPRGVMSLVMRKMMEMRQRELASSPDGGAQVVIHNTFNAPTTYVEKQVAE